MLHEERSVCPRSRASVVRGIQIDEGLKDQGAVESWGATDSHHVQKPVRNGCFCNNRWVDKILLGAG